MTIILRGYYEPPTPHHMSVGVAAAGAIRHATRLAELGDTVSCRMRHDYARASDGAGAHMFVTFEVTGEQPRAKGGEHTYSHPSTHART